MDVRDENGVRHVTFDRPDSKNALTADVARDLAGALEGLDPDALDAVVITGTGSAFSAGGDVQAMADREESAREAYDRVRGTLGRVAEAVLTAPLPVIAKVNGDAVGAGLSLVAAADFAYAAPDARFGASFINVGLVPDLGGTVTLPRLVGLRTAKELAFTGDLIDAERAAALDLINEVAPDGELEATVDDLIETLAARPTENLALAKEALHENLGQPIDDGLRREAHFQTLAYDTDAHREGVEAFLEGRRPDFD
ncbi:enoyl-CoA hydratase/isomerase family protein [Halorubrum cibi]|uniref:Enoyl-CoA hydratase/carnithine racemase n=1 Tax=Halorubrum cibi TaxID=413815 RepID=A0A521D624_9EURY|nr:enoyl-CoA hydratase-related protein [Halorubrum cibi]SMO66551.1 Enoyl-CoA hydratase/carnithine racemase [Halorubrum cibi]